MACGYMLTLLYKHHIKTTSPSITRGILLVQYFLERQIVAKSIYFCVRQAVFVCVLQPSLRLVPALSCSQGSSSGSTLRVCVLRENAGSTLRVCVLRENAGSTLRVCVLRENAGSTPGPVRVCVLRESVCSPREIAGSSLRVCVLRERTLVQHSECVFSERTLVQHSECVFSE